MKRSQRRLLSLIAAIPVVLVAAALLYMFAMARFEGAPRTFWQALEWAAGTLSTTGYGRDSTWNHPFMVVLVSIIPCR